LGMKQIAGSPVVFRSPTLICMCLMLASGWTVGQQTQNSLTITGHVDDSSGASIAGAQITLRDAGGTVKVRTVTNSAGQFSISGVLPGEYVLQTERKMFETSRRDVSVSAVTPPVELQIVLKVGSRKETVEVVGSQGYAVVATTVVSKTDTPILETPFSVQVVPQEVLRDQQVTRIEQAVQNVSNVYQTRAAFSDFADQFVIRGFLNYQVLYRDGFRIDTGNTGKQETANIEQIEVVKGPASILYGRIEPGGLINYITKKPLPDSHFALEQQFGSFSSYRTSLDATGPILENKLAYRLNGSYEHDGSFRQFVGDERWFVSPVLQWRISPATELTLDWEYFSNKTTPDNIGLIPYGDRPLSGLVNVNNVLQNFPTERNLGEPTDFHNATQQIINVSFSHLFNSHWQLKSMFNFALTNENGGGAYADFSTDEDVNRGILPRTIETSEIGLKFLTHVATYAFEINMLGKFHALGVKHNLLLGGDFYRQSGDQTCCDINGLLLDDISIFAPVHGVTIGPVDPTLAFTIYGGPSWYGLYLQDQVQLPHHFFVLAGMRYDLARDYATSKYGTGKSSDHKLSPRVGVLWQPREWLSLYGSYVENFGATNGGLIDRNNQPLPPETAQQWEVGLKTAFGRRLLGTLAYYNLTKENIAAADPLFPNDGRHALTIGKANSHGLEFDLAGSFLPHWNLLVAYAYTDATIVNDSFLGTAGNRLSNVPKNGGRIWTTYSFWGGEPKRLTVGAGVTARSAREGNISNDYLLPGFATVDTMASYSFHLHRSTFALQVNIHNLLDRNYYEASGDFTRSRIAPGSPFAVMSSIRFTL
jgi:iron complex outermembrane receptor protein